MEGVEKLSEDDKMPTPGQIKNNIDAINRMCANMDEDVVIRVATQFEVEYDSEIKPGSIQILIGDTENTSSADAHCINFDWDQARYVRNFVNAIEKRARAAGWKPEEEKEVEEESD